jgi:hypothetical protein
MPMSGRDRLPRAWQSAAMAYETGRPTVADPSTVTNRDEFGAFVEAVLADYLDLGRAEWENATVERLLDALSAFATTRVVTVIDDQEAPSWRLFAEMLHAATGYE